MPTLSHDAITIEAAKHNTASWIDDGQKSAVIALSVKLDDPVPLQEMTPHHWAFADVRFDMPPHWREWLGTIRTGFLKEARPAEPEPAQHSVYTQDPHKFLEDLVDRWIAADEAEKAEQRAERIAQGLPAEPASETEALQMRIAELEAENERLRGVLPSPEARAITPTESEVIPPGEIPDLDANKAPGWQKQSWTGPEDGTLSWLRPVPKTRRIRLCGRFPYRPTIGGACGMYRPPIGPVSAIERAIVCM